MSWIKLDYVHQFTDRHGKVRRYFRRPGFKRVALPGLPGSPEFMAAYEAALSGGHVRKPIGAARTASGTINSAVVSYYASTAFLSLSVGTQRARRVRLEKFRATHGDRGVATLNRAHIETMIAKMMNTPAEAGNFLKALRGLMKHAVAVGLRGDDPTEGVTKPVRRSAGIHTWTEEEISQFEEQHPIGSRARLALALLLYTAQRRGDVIRMGRQHIRNGDLHLTQRKTGASLAIPVHSELAEIIAATPNNHLTFLTTATGAAFSDAGFGNLFRDWCREAGLPEHCSAHGLRKAACRRLAEAGASANVIASISGHRTLRMVEGYTRAADQARMAKKGMDMIAKGTKTGKP